MGANRGCRTSRHGSPGRPCASGLAALSRNGLASSADLAGLGPVGPRGPEDGPPALVLPGFLAGDRTTMDIRRALARSGWRVYPWGLGVNRGAKPTRWSFSARRLDEIYDGRRVLLIGWSLGGMFARQLAHRASRQGARGGDARARPSPAITRPTPMSASFMSGSRATTSTSRPFRESRASRRCRPWPSGRGGTGSSRRARRAGSTMRSTARSRSTPTMSARCCGGRRWAGSCTISRLS